MDLNFIRRFLPELLNGTIVTAELAGMAIAAALLLGLVVALAEMSRWRAISTAARAYVEIARNTPLLVQLYLIYFGLAMMNLGVSGFLSGCMALSLQNTAYIAEIYRAGLQSVSRLQVEGGKALGMSRYDVLTIVVLPQAVVRMLPPLFSQFILIVKDTSIVSAIAVGELMEQGKLLSERTASTYEIFLAVAMIYLLITSAVTLFGRFVEHRFAVVR